MLNSNNIDLIAERAEISESPSDRYIEKSIENRNSTPRTHKANNMYETSGLDKPSKNEN